MLPVEKLEISKHAKSRLCLQEHQAKDCHREREKSLEEMLQSEQALLSPPVLLWERLPFVTGIPTVVEASG